MKTILTAALVFCFFLAVNAQTYNSSCMPTGNMEAIYRNDAYYLSIKWVNDNGSVYKDSILIPQVYRDSIAKTLYAVYNMTGSTVRDTIVSHFGFSYFPPYFGYTQDSLHTITGGSYMYNFRMKVLYVTVNNTASWASDWASGNYSNTAFTDVNELINRYSLQVFPQSLQPYPDKKVYTILSMVNLNIPALKNRFQSFNGVFETWPQTYFGDANTIETYKVNDGIVVIYSKGCGDCPAGCTSRRTWSFKVKEDCSVEYLSVTDWGWPFLPNDPCLSVVPVQLKNFKVAKKPDHHLLQWEMQKQDEVKFYEVQRSINSAAFAAVVDVPAKLISGVVQYEWPDYDLISGNLAYRIKIVTIDGRISYSTIVNIRQDASEKIRVTPSLVTQQQVKLQLDRVSKGMYMAKLISQTGQLVYSTALNVSSENFSQDLRFPAAIAAGNYVLQVTGNKQTFSKPVMIVKE